MIGVSKSPLNVLSGFVFLCVQLPTEGCKHCSLAHMRWCFLLDCSLEEALAASPEQLVLSHHLRAFHRSRITSSLAALRAAASCEAHLGVLDN